MPRVAAGFVLALLGVAGALGRRRYQAPDFNVTFPGGHSMSLTVLQIVSILLIPLGLVIGTLGYFLHRKFMRTRCRIL
jgi:hypothetical protein